MIAGGRPQHTEHTEHLAPKPPHRVGGHAPGKHGRLGETPALGGFGAHAATVLRRNQIPAAHAERGELSAAEYRRMRCNSAI